MKKTNRKKYDKKFPSPLYNGKRKEGQLELTLRDSTRDLLIQLHGLERELNKLYKKLNLGEED